ncbi:MAG: ParB/RepB/Spo0J family partition protein [Candidatus Shapirobacteria bacterium]|nr:ParB/RepB/Spo0J family partition protein [Candidatus Shapirobacteria bacterium]
MSKKETFNYSNHNGIETKKTEYQDVGLLPFKEKEIYLNEIIVLPQPRTTFLFIDELAESIRLSGLLNPILVAEFDLKGYKRHLEIMSIKEKNEESFPLFKKSQNSQEEEKYYVLIGGERRVRAIKKLKERGINLKEVFPSGKIPARVCQNPSPEIFIRIQLAENTYSSPPPYENAEFINKCFNILKKYDKKLSLTAFSGIIDQAYTTVKKATRFCRLPLFIQSAVKDGVLKYGIACEISEMEQRGFDEIEMDIMARRASENHWTVDHCREEVIEKIKEKFSNQQSLEILTQENREEMEKSFQKDKMSKKLFENSYEFLHLFYVHNYLLEKNQIEIKDSSYQEEKLLKITSKLYEMTEKYLPNFKKITEEKKKHYEEVGRKMQKQINEALIYESKTKKE